MQDWCPGQHGPKADCVPLNISLPPLEEEGAFSEDFSENSMNAYNSRVIKPILHAQKNLVS